MGGPVLIVDDDPVLARSVGRALTLEGYEVLVADNGQTALDLARDRGLSLILLDLAMPVMGGVEFLEQYAGGAPVVLLSALLESHHWASDVVVDAVAKPFDLDDLVTLVAKHLDVPEDSVALPDEERALQLLVQGIARERDPKSLEGLYRMLSPLGLALCQQILSDRMLAEDALQEAFLTVWQKAHTFDPGRGSARGWLLTLIRNHAIDRLRRGKPARLVDRQPAAFEPRATVPDVWFDVKRKLDRELIVAALRALPEDQRRAIELAYFGGYTHAEMAASLGIPLGTVKGRLRLGMDKLRLLMQDSGARPSLN